MSGAPYTREELSAMPRGASPERGTFCRGCSAWIPVFALDDETEAAIWAIPRPIERMARLMHVTCCNPCFAKLWVQHPDGLPEGIGPPCPYCGVHLFAAETRQCVACGWDWHDPAQVVNRLTGETAPPRP